MKVDVIIPVYKPDEKLITIINKLKNQSVVPAGITLMNTEEKYWDNFLMGRKLDTGGIPLRVKHVSAWEFDHGKTRNEGAKGSTADFLLFMTQDAIPFDDKLIESLLEGFSSDNIASAYARQLAASDASPAEVFSRDFNYPDTPGVKSLADKNRLGIKTFFCSNACAMYKRECFEKLGGFPKNMIFNEDMVYAGNVIENGFCIAYVPKAKVIHSHNYTNLRQFKRNFDLAVSQAMHPEVFEGVSSESEGKKYAALAFKYFCGIKKPFYFIPFAFTCAVRLIAFKLGKNYKRLPKGLVLRCTDSPLYFKKMWS